LSEYLHRWSLFMSAISRLLLLALLLASATPHGAQAQQDQIPKELALALIPFGSSEGGEIIVGKLPPDLAASIALPAGVRVLGSFVSLGYGQAVLTLPVAADSARSLIRAQLLGHGWTPIGPTGSRMGGLQFGQRGSQPNLFCKTGAAGTLNVTTQFYGRETLVRLTRSGDMSGCDAEVRGLATTVGVTSMTLSSREALMPLSSLPPLWSPGDPMSSMRACRPQTPNGMVPYQSQEQWLRTDQSAQAILDYYGQQLDSAGWKPATAPNEHAVRTWSKVNGDTAQDVTLTVTKLSTPGCFEIGLRASAREPRR
jgi:hypothetical protein